MPLLKISDFAPHVGKSVRIVGTPFTLTLDRIEGEDVPPPDGYERSPFLIIYRGSRDAVMAPGIYDCAFEGGPTLNLHVAPIHTQAADRQEYQSAFN
ncbi:MAG TPA: hypothetical protein VMH86_15340 [Rhizomicrobium sp.]|nr:hypothetical protein [Rhizomicrobium sp.]